MDVRTGLAGDNRWVYNRAMHRTRGWLVWFAVATFALGSRVRADELHVAVAANFLGTFEKLVPLFQRAHGHTLVPSAGATGQLYAQIQRGAPFDVLLAADGERPAKLEADGLAVKGTRFTYASGRLVLWSPKQGVVDAAGELLKSSALRFVAIADPKSAPYGVAAEKVLESLHVLAPLRAAHKLALGESAAQAYQFTATGNADCGFVALSQVIEPDGSIPGSSWIVPPHLYGNLDQAAVLLRASKKQPLGRLFLGWLRNDPGALSIIRAAGYLVAAHASPTSR
jgi:molybdate transport system substrate-binding protein